MLPSAVQVAVVKQGLSIACGAQVWAGQHGLSTAQGGQLSGHLLTAFVVHVHTSGLLVSGPNKAAVPTHTSLSHVLGSPLTAWHLQSGTPESWLAPPAKLWWLLWND